jgi:hypothetical protein
MKTIHLLLVLVCLAPGIAHASLVGQPVIDITATAPDLVYQQISSKTNVVHGFTNDTTVLKSTTTNFTMNAASFLTLLTNSFNTNFPAGTQLLLLGGPGYYSFQISDSTGTNLAVFPVYLVFGANTEGFVHSGVTTELLTNQFLSAGKDTESFTTAASFVYNDYGFSTADGTHTYFHLNGLLDVKSTNSLVTGSSTQNITMTLTGGGQIRGGPPLIFTGTFNAKLIGGAVH